MATTAAGNAITKPVIQLMTDVIKEEDNRQILHTDLRSVESHLQYTHIFLGFQQKEPPEIVKIWLQLLQNSLTEAKGLFDRSGQRQSCINYVVCNPRRLSNEIREWNALLNHLYHGFQSDFQYTALSGNAMISVVVDPVMERLKDVIEDDNRQILQTDLRRIETLLLDITTLFRDEPNITTLFQSPNKAFLEIITWLPLLENSLTEAKRCLLRQSCNDRVMYNPRRKWSASFDQIYHGFQSDLSILVTSLQFLSSNPLHIEEKAKEPTVIQPLSRDEAWMLFRRVVFKDDKVSMDIEDRARKIAEQCRGVSLAIHVVAAAMIGQTSLHEWDICLSSIQNVDPSFPATASGLDAQLYAALRFSYDALPNSDVKKCFLYCALYNEEQEIDTLELLQMWIGEGVVKSKQGTYLMDMAVGRKYLKLLVDRCLFQIVKERTDVLKGCLKLI